MSDYGFYPPGRDHNGNLTPHPQARYLTVSELIRFTDAIREELREVGGIMLLNKVQHLFGHLDEAIGAHMRADDQEAQRRRAQDAATETEDSSEDEDEDEDTVASGAVEADEAANV